MDDPRYPVGPFTPPATYTDEGRQAFIRDIAALPAQVRAAVAGLTPAQLQHPYRDGGWSAAQVVHHLADSHMNSYIRFKLAATADNPTVVGYDEAAWARFPDATSTDLDGSLAILDAVHARWVRFLESLGPEDFARTFNHSVNGPVPLDRALALYAWHGRHHTAHITGLRARQGWLPAVPFKPAGVPTMTPYLVVRGAPKLIDFLKAAFGAVELDRTIRPDGSVMNATLQIGDSPVMMGEATGPREPFPAMLYVYVLDVDATYARALAAGAATVMAPADLFYGDRNAGVRDAFGNEWWIATHKEDVPPDELQRRASAQTGRSS
jgi:uncharacterized glyoxalase superfamily protein PhnB/uncharacterized damage-inducible protein DinB